MIIIFTAILIAMWGGPLQAETQYQYPELAVSPRASETLENAARLERSSRWTQHLPGQVPALLNLFTGLRLMGENADPEDFTDPLQNIDQLALDEKTLEIQSSGKLAAAIGGGWLGTTLFMSFYYSPYRSDFRTVGKMKGNSQRDQLVRERRSEEILADAASTAKKLKYIGVTLNLAAAGIVAGATNDQQTTIQAGLAGLAALLPFIIDNEWETTYQRHIDYKKKIYAPLVEFQTNPKKDGSLNPSLLLTWKF